MTENHAYMVSVLFGAPPTGKMFLNAIIAQSPEHASAMVVANVIQVGGVTEPLTGLAVQRLQTEFLRGALNGGEAKVIPMSLVPPPTAEQLAAQQSLPRELAWQRPLSPDELRAHRELLGQMQTPQDPA